ncbi:MAG: formate dehydrogenase accessory sulfurtransferase FdhD [Betaproteobacteria bacterium]|nr:formate dehydrogenase accessory sulfurtransferase FdhD [Betaproteobacteria bacterium]MCC6248487.1 formate dehydrogenase accessory sulfurtransferase FdhD [Rubrivivax sp.]MCL4696186.1 formate dehydrogenase accessory sulfurtransferase FdhD [Burkholderiaceae bacterium]
MNPSASGHLLPRLSAARVPLTREVLAVTHEGGRKRILLAAERPLTLYVDRQELVTLMTLGQEPELLALGYLLNQGLVRDAAEIESITVDWDVAAAAVRTREGIAQFAERVARRTVTTGCGQGTVFGDWLERVPPLPAVAAMADAAGATAAAAHAAAPPGSVPHDVLVELLQTMRGLPSVHRDAGSVHGTALWRAPRRSGEADDSDDNSGAAAKMLVHIEDVGRHNAVDTVAGWMAMHGVDGAGCWLYTTGRLTSEMVLKAAHLRIPVVVSRNGATAMGQQLAERLNLTLIGRANGQRYLCYAGAARLVGLPEAVTTTV